MDPKELIKESIMSSLSWYQVMLRHIVSFKTLYFICIIQLYCGAKIAHSQLWLYSGLCKGILPQNIVV